jgi:bifunctional DNase/RNase
MTWPSDVVMVAIITATPAMISAVVTIMTHRRMNTLETNTNHKMDQMLATTAKASKAEGVLQEKTNPSK